MKILMTIMQKVQSVFKNQRKDTYLEQQIAMTLQPSSIEREERLNRPAQVAPLTKEEKLTDEILAANKSQSSIVQQSIDQLPPPEVMQPKVESQPMHKFEVADSEPVVDKVEPSEQYAEERVKESPLKKLLINNLQLKRKRPLPIKEREDK